MFRDGQAIVDVGKLKFDERRQILYNHIKAGVQPGLWKQKIKPHLDMMAQEERLLPEIARRLGDPVYTKRLSIDVPSLLAFIREPKEHLLQTIRELSRLHRAALTLVFLHRGHIPLGGAAPAMQELVVKHYSVDTESLGQAVLQLRDSFLVQKTTTVGPGWTFKHPTISDALRTVLGETEGMAELYLRGATPEAILTEVTCQGDARSEDRFAIPAQLNELLVERLTETPDELRINSSLFAFLAERASEGVFRFLLRRDASVLARQEYGSRQRAYNDKVNTHARALKLGLLPPTLREEVATDLLSALIEDRDTSFLDNDDILALIAPTELLRVPGRIRDEVLELMPSVAESIQEEADLDIEPRDNFDDLRGDLNRYRELLEGDGRAKELLKQAEIAIGQAIGYIENARQQRDTLDDEDWDWGSKSGVGTGTGSQVETNEARSIFSDVDE